ncbi:26699_t:CDS:2, partial [Racocetra persica]
MPSQCFKGHYLNTKYYDQWWKPVVAEFAISTRLVHCRPGQKCVPSLCENRHPLYMQISSASSAWT